ncbi:hypothetical protein KJ807_06015, partial [Patescibacteria group bacterium]|nr:hypothetical protein [Patescibacteria group bacterium]
MIIDWESFDKDDLPDIIVSTNELVTNPKLIQRIEKCKLKLFDMAIPIGDFIIRGNPNVVIERKKVSDWLASQRDGRMHSQKKNLTEGVDGALSVIIIHGHYKQHVGHQKRWKPQQACGTIANQIFYTIPVLKVPDDEWFARTLKSIHNLVNQDREWKPRAITLNPRVPTDEEWGLNVLMGIDKVGPIGARKLAMQFDT